MAAMIPHDATRWLRSAVRDTLLPGQAAVNLAWLGAQRALEAGPAETALRARMRELEAQLRQERQQNRQLLLEAARLRERLADVQLAGAEPAGRGSAPLLVPQLVEARWLGTGANSSWRSLFLVDAAAAQGVAESAWVLERPGPFVDLGSAEGLASGDQVLAGRIVVGKIAEVGRYVSTVLKVTDPNFSARARIYRRTSAGLVAGPEGTLSGDGTPLCRLKHVGEPVNAGDEVFTSEEGRTTMAPLYLGRVARAEPGANEREWNISVQPAARPTQQEVHILRLSLNPRRLLAN
jgi:hypothetical protein